MALLALLLAVAALGLGMAASGRILELMLRRDKEAELLFIGLQYREAIRRYYQSPPTGRYPPTLEDLLRDPRQPGLVRHLRQPWRDPLTGVAKWGLVMAPEGGIMGVHSLAQGVPLKQAGFPSALGWPEGEAGGPRTLGSYGAWTFVFRPSPPPGPVTPTKPVTRGSS